MITNLHLKNFKIHSDLNLPLGRLTIITGQNGMGKSSVLQSLLLLRQSYNRDGINGINLKGDLADLGSADDVECQSCKDGILNIQLTLDDESSFDFIYSYNDVEPNETFIPTTNDSPKYESFSKCSLFSNKFQYISAFRFGPQKTYERDTNIVKYQRQISKKNGQCEYAVHFLYFYSKNIENDKENKEDQRIHCNHALMFDGTTDDLLDTQVEYWMQQISPNVKINIDSEGQDLKLKYKFRRDGNMITNDMYAINVGYGITYVLPILVAILSAEPGALILIENPEAHIHPHAQAELMKLVMKAAKAGIQIIIETHSDHIMNGALVAIAQDATNLDLVKAYYFERDEHTHTSVPRSLKILEDGRIVNPPKGFFDQIDIDMKLIMGF